MSFHILGSRYKSPIPITISRPVTLRAPKAGNTVISGFVVSLVVRVGSLIVGVDMRLRPCFLISASSLAWQDGHNGIVKLLSVCDHDFRNNAKFLHDLGGGPGERLQWGGVSTRATAGTVYLLVYY